MWLARDTVGWIHERQFHGLARLDREFFDVVDKLDLVCSESDFDCVLGVRGECSGEDCSKTEGANELLHFVRIGVWCLRLETRDILIYATESAMDVYENDSHKFLKTSWSNLKKQYIYGNLIICR